MSTVKNPEVAQAIANIAAAKAALRNLRDATKADRVKAKAARDERRAAREANKAVREAAKAARAEKRIAREAAKASKAAARLVKLQARADRIAVLIAKYNAPKSVKRRNRKASKAVNVTASYKASKAA